jgi:hypothetical protein
MCAARSPSSATDPHVPPDDRRFFGAANPGRDRVTLVALWVVGSLTIGSMAMLYAAKATGQGGSVAALLKANAEERRRRQLLRRVRAPEPAAVPSASAGKDNAA